MSAGGAEPEPVLVTERSRASTGGLPSLPTVCWSAAEEFMWACAAYDPQRHGVFVLTG